MIAMQISTTITDPMSLLIKNLERGATGDYSARMNYQSRDEIGQVASFFNQFMERLGLAIHEREQLEQQWIEKDDTDRIMQANTLLEKLKDTEYPTIVVGDLNAEPDSEPIQILLKEFTKPDIPDAYLPTWSSEDPSKCIDHILFNMPKKWKVIDYEVLCENYATDHCIVIATLVFTP